MKGNLPHNITIPDDIREDFIKLAQGALWKSMLRLDKKVRIQKWFMKLYEAGGEDAKTS